MTYQDATQYLFSATPVFQHIGGAAYKPGLARMQALDAYYKHPHTAYQTIHVGGTNGKGSTSHTLAAILQSAGYRVGLFTSPHLLDFRERIRVDGLCISEDYVVSFVEGCQALVEEHQPSFFELTCMMAFSYFAHQGVDIAIIEVGLGGRLDCSNIISPICSVITNISLEHTQYLGSTLVEIAREKAGIIKSNTPVVIGQAETEELKAVFEEKAKSLGANISFAQEEHLLYDYQRGGEGYIYDTAYGQLLGQLQGEAQTENTATILAVIRQLQKQLTIPQEAIRQGFAEVCDLTGLMGRWQCLQKEPTLICDTGHNEAGLRLILQQIAREDKRHRELHLVLGFAGDKDVAAMLHLLPKHYHYYWTQASTSRAMPAIELYEMAQVQDLQGGVYATVAEAVETALREAESEDFVFVGGSNFIVADLLQWHREQTNAKGEA